MCIRARRLDGVGFKNMYNVHIVKTKLYVTSKLTVSQKEEWLHSNLGWEKAH